MRKMVVKGVIKREREREMTIFITIDKKLVGDITGILT